MPSQTQATPQLPEPPVPPPPPGATVVTSGGDGKAITIQVPQTDAQVYALVSRRDQLSSQIQDAMARRQGLVSQIREAPDGVARTGLEQQVSLLDERILSMERELAATETQLAQSPADLISFAERESRPAQPTDRLEMFGLMGVIIVATILLSKLSRRWSGRSRQRSSPSALPPDTTERLERLERGVESIAIEIERISEGQRFVTKLMAENAPSRKLDRVE